MLPTFPCFRAWLRRISIARRASVDNIMAMEAIRIAHCFVLVNHVVVLVHAFGSLLDLGTNECFERVAIGKKLNLSDISKSVMSKSLRQCDIECEREMCNAYAFGVTVQGNSTCDISAKLPQTIPIDDPEYDLFVKIYECQNMTTCFRRLVTGRRLADRFIRRVLPCDALRHCQLACAIEKEFVCEGFNFRFEPTGESLGSCQLTSYPADHLDLSQDFNSDLAYDFFERDRNAGPGCNGWSIGGPSQWGSKGPYLPPKFDPHAGGGIPYGWNKPAPHYPLAPPNELPGVYGGGKIDHIYKGQPHHSVTEGLTPPFALPNVPLTDECFMRARSGFRLERSIIVMSLNAPTLYDCEFHCANERKFTCNIFGFRYSANAATDNCQLGERTIRQIDLYSDLVPDRDYDVYVRNELGRPGCQPTKTFDSDCFERLRSGLRLEGVVVKFTISTQTLSECQLVCLHIKHFTCRALSYRYGSPTIGSPADNCILTDWPMTELDPTKHFVDDAGYELYHRASYGHGCELDRWPFLSPAFPTIPTPEGPAGGYPTPRPPFGGYPHHPRYPPPSGPPTGSYPPPASPPSDGGYPAAGPPPGGFPHGFPHGGGGHYPPDGAGPPYLPPTDHKPPLWPSYPPPKGGSYPPPNYPPAYLPPKKPIDRPTIFSTPGFIPNPPTYGLGGYLPPSSYGPTPHIPRPTDQICYISYGTPARLLPAAVKTSLIVPSELDCKAECSRVREKSQFRCASLSYRSGNCELSDIELRDLRPDVDFAKDEHYWLHSWDFTDARCYVPPAGKIPYPGAGGGGGGGGYGGAAGPGVYINIDRGESTWQRFTVTGRPCKAGTFCTENLDVGVWSCPVDDGDWDYCCRAGHHCGYSEGYNYPWCYVGSLSRTQWRPCSNFYFPYQPSNRPLHWPVAYLHREGPPNITMGHQPSIVDSFLNSLKYEHTRKLGDLNGTDANNTTTPPTFEVVDVKLIPEAEPSTKPKDDQSEAQSGHFTKYAAPNETLNTKNYQKFTLTPNSRDGSYFYKHTAPNETLNRLAYLHPHSNATSNTKDQYYKTMGPTGFSNTNTVGPTASSNNHNTVGPTNSFNTKDHFYNTMGLMNTKDRSQTSRAPNESLNDRFNTRDHAGAHSSHFHHFAKAPNATLSPGVVKRDPPPTTSAVAKVEKVEKPLDAMTKMWAWGQAKYNSSSMSKDQLRISNRIGRTFDNSSTPASAA
nr:PREDICTED: uncharacterized protein LOC109044389 [Bemisia tabaci]